MTTLVEIERRAFEALRPPLRLRLSEWIERHLVLPEGTSALPGRVRLWLVPEAQIEAGWLAPPSRRLSTADELGSEPTTADSPCWWMRRGSGPRWRMPTA
jgi:hypothetical protein